jgi:hypothetical protein
MTPQSVISDLIYVEKYHRSKKNPLTADIISRARSLIYSQSLALGTLETKNDERVMICLVSEIDYLTSELKRLRELLALHPELEVLNNVIAQNSNLSLNTSQSVA